MITTIIVILVILFVAYRLYSSYKTNHLTEWEDYIYRLTGKRVTVTKGTGMENKPFQLPEDMDDGMIYLPRQLAIWSTGQFSGPRFWEAERKWKAKIGLPLF